jgi:hypothetical protein
MPSFGEADMSEAQEPRQHFVDMFTQDEIEALHGLAANKKVWWNDGSLIVAACAFVLSLATTLFSIYTGYQKDLHDQQAQLAASIQVLQDLAIKQAENTTKYASDPQSAFGISKLIIAQVQTTAHTATELGRRLGTNATTSELWTIAQIDYGNGEAAAAKELLQIALAAANSPNDESIALRYLGFLQIRAADTPDDVAAGEALFQRAATLETKYDLRGFPQVVAFLKVSAQFDWAQAIAPINCQGAIAHYKDGEQLLSSQPPNTLTSDLQQARQLAQQNARIGLGGVASCRPPA